MINYALDFASLANQGQSAFYVIPGVVGNSGEASSIHVTQMQVLLIDIDDGDTEEKLLNLSAVLGEPTLIVESGGVTSDGCLKMHVYWQLVKGVSGDDLKILLNLRYQIALSFGGDTHFKSAHQPIRVAGSVYHKNGLSKLVKIRSYSRLEYELEELVAAYQASNHHLTNESINSSDIPATTSIFTSKVFEGSVTNLSRFSSLQRVIGYWLRRYHEGLINEDQAMEEIFAYNEANVVPAWDSVRLKKMIDGIWQKHVKEHGEAKKAQEKIVTEQNHIILEEWTVKRYQDKAPEQHYLVESTIPMRVATILAATGDTGKSMLLLNLALQVAGDDEAAESFGHKITQRGTAIVFTAEDDIEEVHRRLEYLDPVGLRNKNPERLIIVPLASTAGALTCIIKNKDGIKISPEFIELKKQITEIEDLKLIIFDPLSSFVQADISKDPSDGSFVTGVFANLASETGAAVILAHHMRKPQGNYRINTTEDAREAVRGSGALVDGVRNVYSLWQSPQEEQKMVFSVFGMDPEPNKVYRGAVVKCNSKADRNIHIFLRSEKGLLQDVSQYMLGNGLSEIQIQTILRNSIAHSAAEGFPYTHTGQAGIYKQRHKLPKMFHDLPRKQLEDIVQKMLNKRPALIVKGRAAGSKEEKWLDVPAGKFATGEGGFREGAELN